MFEKEAEEKLSEEDYKLAEEVMKPIYYNAIKMTILLQNMVLSVTLKATTRLMNGIM